MKGNVLGFVENNIAMRLLLTSRLAALGYHVTVVSNLRAFLRHLMAGSFDWLILHEAAFAGAPGLPTRLARYRHGARIVWLGRPPRRRELPITARFATPLVYGEIAQYFSQQTPRESQGDTAQVRGAISQERFAQAPVPGGERS